MHSMASNVNLVHSVDSSPQAKESKEYLTDELKHIFDQAKREIEKAISDDERVRAQDHRDEDDEEASKEVNSSNLLLDLSGISFGKYNHTSLLSPESDIAGPFDTAMGSACRRNPAELYKTTAEAMEQALDDKPGVCPDHEDDCQCHLISSLPIFNLEDVLKKRNIESPDRKHHPKTLKESDCSPCSAQEFCVNVQQVVSENNHFIPSDPDTTSPNTEEFLPRTPVMDRQFSKDDDLSFDDHCDFLDPCSPQYDSEDSDEADDEILEFFPNNHDSDNYLRDQNTSDNGIGTRRKSNKSSPSKPKSPGFNILARIEARKRSQEQKRISKKHSKPENRLFNISMPRSPHGRRSRQVIQYESLDYASGRNRIDVPRTIEVRAERSTKNIRGEMIDEKLSRKNKRKKLTIPKTPKLLTKRKMGERRYSTVGLQKSQDDEAGMTTLLLGDTQKRSLTIPKEPRLRSKEKLGERKYSIVGKECKEVETLDTVHPKQSSKPRSLTQPKSPKLVLSEKLGKRRYSTVGQQHTEQHDNRIAAEKGATTFRIPRFSVFVKKYNDIEKDGVIENSVSKVAVNGKTSESHVFRARPVPDFSKSLLQAAKSKPSARPLTVPQPFHLATNERAQSPRRSKEPHGRKEDLSNKEKDEEEVDGVKGGESYVFRARPVPDFSRSLLQSAKNTPSARPLTVPQPFHLATNERAQSPRRSRDSHGRSKDFSNKEELDGVKGGESYVFRARPVPDFSRSLLQSAKSKPSARPLTVPQPFHLATNDRVQSPRRSKEPHGRSEDFSNKEELDGVKGGENYVFRARPVPDFSRALLQSAKSKPSARPLTVPQPFQLTTCLKSDQSVMSSLQSSALFDGDVLDHQYKSSSRPPQNVSRNPNKHRTALAKRVSGQKPFRLLAHGDVNIVNIRSKSVSSIKSSGSSKTSFDENKSLPSANISDNCSFPGAAYKEKHKNDGNLKQRLETRSKQSSVARAEQYNETLNVVDHLIERNICLLSTSLDLEG